VEITQEPEWLAAQFERHRQHLRVVAYRMLGSHSEADDAVQESWFRLTRGDSSAIDDLRGWLTTVVGRICLDMLRSRRATREQSVGSWLPEPVVQGDGPEQQAEVADSLGFALLVVLDTLTPAERIAFVLHDVFALPFDEIAPIVERSPEATRQLASRARRRVRLAPQPDRDLAQQRRAVAAFLAAARSGDFEALLAVLDPEVVFRADLGPSAPGSRPPIRGARAVATEVLALPRAISPACIRPSSTAQPVRCSATWTILSESSASRSSTAESSPLTLSPTQPNCLGASVPRSLPHRRGVRDQCLFGGGYRGVEVDREKRSAG
jgi:RNA polymerase sigma-70 factor (ECF subfamily)